MVGHDVQLGVHKAQPAAVGRKLVFVIGHGQKQRGKIGERAHFGAEVFNLRLEPVQRGARDADGLGNLGQNLVALCGLQRLAHTAGHNPSWMNPLAAQSLQHPLPELAQLDAVARHRRMLARHAQDVALRRIGVHPQQKIGRRKIEEAERVGLDDLRQVHDAAQLLCRLRDAHRHDLVARLAGGQQVAGGTDAADARHQRRHLGEGAAFAELFKAAHLGYMEACILHLSLLVQLHRDAGVALDAGYGIDRQCRHTAPRIQSARGNPSPACALPAVR